MRYLIIFAVMLLAACGDDLAGDASRAVSPALIPSQSGPIYLGDGLFNMDKLQIELIGAVGSDSAGYEKDLMVFDPNRLLMHVTHTSPYRSEFHIINVKDPRNPIVEATMDPGMIVYHLQAYDGKYLIYYRGVSPYEVVIAKADGSLEVETTLPYKAYDLWVHDNVLAIATEKATILYNLDTRAEITTIAHDNNAKGVHISGNFLFCGVESEGIYLYNIKDPSSPKFLSDVMLPALGGESIFQVKDKTLFYTEAFGYVSGYILMYDFSDPHDIHGIGNFLASSISDLEIVRNTLVMSNTHSGPDKEMVIKDVNIPSIPGKSITTDLVTSENGCVEELLTTSPDDTRHIAVCDNNEKLLIFRLKER